MESRSQLAQGAILVRKNNKKIIVTGIVICKIHYNFKIV